MLGVEQQPLTITLLRLWLILLYAPLSLYAGRRLLPRLFPAAKLLAALFLAAQIAVIVIALEYQPQSEEQEWLWYLNGEWNIQATLASTQLALVGAVAFLAAALQSKRTVWHRLYLFALAPLFIFLAQDEFHRLHETYPALELVYLSAGGCLALITAVMALRSSGSARTWHLCLLVGLALGAVGFMAVEQIRQPAICRLFGDSRPDGCLWRFFIEEPLEFAGMWLALVAMLGTLSARSTWPRFPSGPILFAFMLFWAVLLFVTSPIHSLIRPAWAQPATIEFESGMALYGYQVEADGLQVALLTSPLPQSNSARLGYSAHLVDQVSGVSVASQNGYITQAERASKKLHGFRPLYRQATEFAIPPDAPRNRALWIVLSLWREHDGEFALDKVVSSDLRLLSDTQVVLAETVLREESTTPAASPLARFGPGLALESVDMPASATLGGSLPITFSWRAESDISEDFSQFLHLQGAEGEAWWGYDQEPLGARLPTRLWQAGLADSESWHVPVPADIAPGQYQAYTGLYRFSDMQRLPASDADGQRWLEARAPLGSIVLE